MLFTIAQPIWDSCAVEGIEAFRAAHDPQYGLLAAHFTVAFGMDVELPAWRAHVQKVAASRLPFRFVLRHAMLFALDKERAHVFLVPDEGASQVARLYGALHMGGWAKHRRLDIPYIPHITVAVAGRVDQAQAWVEEWNNQPFEWAGQVDALSIGKLRDGRFVTLAQERLGARS
jgi:2'-5' RNA ligase